jgi:hypothetical protein
MNQDVNAQDIDNKIAERFRSLPKAVQDAITSADVEQHMRELAGQHQLHFDQWSSLENEVMFTLLGIEPIERLADNLKKEVGVTAEVAESLAASISQTIFAPIRAELEKGLASGGGDEESDAPLESAAVKEHPLAQVVPAIAPVLPGTPPAPPPEKKAIRAPISESYGAGQPSAERRIVEGDPYRESVS